jgi:hypothetical protein
VIADLLPIHMQLSQTCVCMPDQTRGQRWRSKGTTYNYYYYPNRPLHTEGNVWLYMHTEIERISTPLSHKCGG